MARHFWQSLRTGYEATTSVRPLDRHVPFDHALDKAVELARVLVALLVVDNIAVRPLITGGARADQSDPFVDQIHEKSRNAGNAVPRHLRFVQARRRPWPFLA